MKRFLGIVLSVLLLVVLLAWSYVSYKQKASYQALIPEHTTALIRVDVYRVYRSLAGSLFRQQKTKRPKFPEGISVPANIFCYTVKDAPPNTLFTILPVDDAQALAESLQQLGFHQTAATSGNITFAENSNRSCVLAYDNKHVAIALLPGKAALQQVLVGLLQQEHMIAVAKSRFSKIKEQDGHITFLTDQGQGQLSFEQGTIVASLEWQTKGMVGKGLPLPTPGKDDALNLYWLGDATRWLQGKQFTADSVHLSGDSLLAAHPRGFILNIGATIVQLDSVVTYDYNDDFEKVATVTVQEHRVPDIRLQLLADTSLYSYLQRAGIVLKDSNTLQRNVFPLYKVYTGTTKERLWAGTSNQAPATVVPAQGPFVFYLQADFGRLQQIPDLAWLSRYTQPYRQIHASARPIHDNRVELHVRLDCKNADESALLQLPRLF